MLRKISDLFSEVDRDKLLSILLKQNFLECQPEDIQKILPDLFVKNQTILQFLLNMQPLTNQHEAVLKIKEAIEDKKKIRVHGDFDADGIFSTLILVETLQRLGADVSYFIPDRLKDGYGMKMQDIDKDIEDGVEFILTCDNGISCKEATEYALLNNIDVVITDHHMPIEGLVPENVIIVDPKFTGEEFSDISGGFVALKVATELLSDNYLQNEELLNELAVFAGITTITDLMPLLSENRLLLRIVFSYIDYLKANSIWSGRVLKVISGLGGFFFMKDPMKLASTELISFSIGPTINAVSRINGNVMGLVRDILDCDEPNIYIPSYYSKLNLERKERTEQIFTQHEVSKDPVSVNVLNQNDYEKEISGLLGLVANKICSSESKPSLVGLEKDDMIDFSARSVQGYSLIDAISRIQEKDPSLKIEGGGHSQAMGIRLLDKTKLKEFETALNEDFSENFNKEEYEEQQNVFVLEDENIDDVVSLCGELEIFGAGFRGFDMFTEGVICDIGINYISVNGCNFRYYIAKDKPNPFEVGKVVKLNFAILTDEVIGPYFKITKYEVEE